ncbi:MAG: diguanylate cyclase (GGDEF)-like protein [Oleispira sp.]|jgi:diguanylate cyclase (GGDEF)-like protein
MFAENQIIAIMTYMITLLIISIIAASLFLYLPRPSKHHDIICLRYFCGYFWVSGLSYAIFILAGAEVLPHIPATFFNNALAITAPYFLYAGLNWHNQIKNHLHQSPLIIFHVIAASTLITLTSIYVEDSAVLVELLFFPNLFIAFYVAYKVLLNNASATLSPGEKLFKRTFQISFISMTVVMIIMIITENFFIYIGGILITQGIMTVGFLSAVYFSFLYRMIDKFKKSSMTDHLTKLYNRRYFLTQANTIIRSMGREKAPICLIMCDLDFFKRINDDYGHHAGDQALIEFANMLRNTLRQQDTIARIGGEEFIILLPDTSMDLVMPICERIRENTEGLEIQVASDTITLTASFGICQIDASHPIESGIKLADQALYKAKSAGRNRVEYYNLDAEA